jgi:hypothetical protein
MIKIKIETLNENGEKIDDFIYHPESAIIEAENISEALKPLGFEVLGFRNKYASYEYILHLRFIGPDKAQSPVITSVGMTDPGANAPPSK